MDWIDLAAEAGELGLKMVSLANELQNIVDHIDSCPAEHLRKTLCRACQCFEELHALIDKQPSDAPSPLRRAVEKITGHVFNVAEGGAFHRRLVELEVKFLAKVGLNVDEPGIEQIRQEFAGQITFDENDASYVREQLDDARKCICTVSGQVNEYTSLARRHLNWLKSAIKTLRAGAMVAADIAAFADVTLLHLLVSVRSIVVGAIRIQAEVEVALRYFDNEG